MLLNNNNAAYFLVSLEYIFLTMKLNTRCNRHFIAHGDALREGEMKETNNATWGLAPQEIQV